MLNASRCQETEERRRRGAPTPIQRAAQVVPLGFWPMISLGALQQAVHPAAGHYRESLHSSKLGLESGAAPCPGNPRERPGNESLGRLQGPLTHLAVQLLSLSDDARGLGAVPTACLPFQCGVAELGCPF